MTIVEYPGIRLDLHSALSQLDAYLTHAESWDLYIAIEMGAYEEVLRKMRGLVRDGAAMHVAEELERIGRQCLGERKV